MANSGLSGKVYEIDDKFVKFLGKSLSYEALKMRLSRMKDFMANDKNRFNGLGGEKTLQYIEMLLNNDRGEIKREKQACSANNDNCFLKTHEKDKDNANPTAYGGMPRLHRGSIRNNIYKNKSVYNENINIDKIYEEISMSRYLIEYMCK